ncbi:chromosome segregation protein Csm1/Pcs1-domain-containing protein [Astrocystis sublimbata]|nr:chromosome segregation protein Csm1/Pcs1-domain-containing protein [Astrocystis sublimbata]
MPPAKKTRATTARATKSSRAKQAPPEELTEKAESAQTVLTRRKGVKRPAEDEINTLENEDGKENKPRPARGRPRANKAQKIATRESEDELSEMHIEATVPAPTRRGRNAAIDTDTEIPETQQDPGKYGASADWPADEETTRHIMAESLRLVEASPRYQDVRKKNMSAEHLPRLRFWNNHDHKHDERLLNQIRELTKKNEALEARYRELRETGVQEADSNFDRLKRQTEEQANTDKQLITALKSQLAGETELAKQAEIFRAQFEDSQKKIEELQGNADEVKSSLAEAKAEIKTLSTKLAAARSVETTSVKVPGSAMKNSHINNRHMASAAEAAAQLANKKENLYGDLTGLLVCGVKRENDDEVFDCVQTGRSGTLHFKLSIGMEGSSDKFEEAQFMYMPQLDAARDADLIDSLPDYLVEEIAFPRLHAAKFYSRVVKALSE